MILPDKRDLWWAITDSEQSRVSLSLLTTNHTSAENIRRDSVPTALTSVEELMTCTDLLFNMASSSSFSVEAWLRDDCVWSDISFLLNGRPKLKSHRLLIEGLKAFEHWSCLSLAKLDDYHRTTCYRCTNDGQHTSSVLQSKSLWAFSFLKASS